MKSSGHNPQDTSGPQAFDSAASAVSSVTLNTASAPIYSDVSTHVLDSLMTCEIMEHMVFMQGAATQPVLLD